MNGEEMRQQGARAVSADCDASFADEARIDAAAAAILEKYRAAFEELAK